MKCKTDVVHLVGATLLALLLIGPARPAARAQASNRAGLVVRLGDGSILARCVEFSGSEISGYDVLAGSGLSIVAAFDSGMGAAVCSIEGQGCPIESCLTCATPNYWAYWHLVNGAWSYSQAGVSSYKVHDGDVEGWSWGTGDPPPVVPFDQICAPPPTDTPSPTSTPPPPTHTPVPPTATSPPATSMPGPVVWFRLDDNPIRAGACTTLRWDTTYVLEVYLDGERVDLNGSRHVCPTASREYDLRIVSAADEHEQVHALMLGVTGISPSPTPTPRLAANPSPSPAPQLAGASSAPASPTSQPGTANPVSPSLTSLPSEPPPPSPSPTPGRVAFASPSPALVRVTQPALTPSPLPSVVSPTSEDRGPPSMLLGYITFNSILIGLLSWLMIKLLRRG